MKKKIGGSESDFKQHPITKMAYFEYNKQIALTLQINFALGFLEIDHAIRSDELSAYR